MLVGERPKYSAVALAKFIGSNVKERILPNDDGSMWSVHALKTSSSSLYSSRLTWPWPTTPGLTQKAVWPMPVSLSSVQMAPDVPPSDRS